MATYQFDFDLSKTFNDEYDDLVFLQYFNDDDPRSKICIIGSTDRVYGIMAYNATTDVIGFIMKNTQASSDHASDAIRSFTTTWTNLKSTLELDDNYLPVGACFDEETSTYYFIVFRKTDGYIANYTLNDQTYEFTLYSQDTGYLDISSIQPSIVSIDDPGIVRVDLTTQRSQNNFCAYIFYKYAIYGDSYKRIYIYGESGYHEQATVSDPADIDIENFGLLKNPFVMRPDLEVSEHLGTYTYFYPYLIYDSGTLNDVSSSFVYLTSSLPVFIPAVTQSSDTYYRLILNDISIDYGNIASNSGSTGWQRASSIKYSTGLRENDGHYDLVSDLDAMSSFTGVESYQSPEIEVVHLKYVSDLYYPEIMNGENEFITIDKSYSGDLLPICSLGNLYDDDTYEQLMIYYYPGNGGIYYIRPYATRSHFPRVSVYEVFEEDYYLKVEDTNGDIGEVQISQDYRIESITATQESDTSILLTIHCYRYDDEDDTQEYTLTLNYSAPEGYEASNLTDADGNTLEIGSTFTYSTYPSPTDSYIIWTLNFTEETQEPEPDEPITPSEGINITLYQRSDDENVLASATDLTLTEIATLNGTFRESTSITNPEITFQWSDYQDFNFVYIRELQRYYFVRDIAFRNNNLITMKLEEDVLTSFHDDIMNLKEVYVERQEFDYNDLLIDNQVPSENEDEMEIICCDNDYIQLSNEISDYSLEGNIVFNIFVHD